MKRPEVPDWSGRVVVVVASGPSAARQKLDLVRERFAVVVVNESWRLAPWADVLFSADVEWWHRAQGWSEFKGAKFTTSRSASVAFPQLRKVNLHAGEGANSGLLAVRMAVVFGARRIILVGFDMTLEGGVHWHGPHRSLRNPGEGAVARWRVAMDAAAEDFRSSGVDVLNVSRASVLNNYRRMSLADAIEDDGCRFEQKSSRSTAISPSS